MGEIADMMIDGVLCEGCGEYMGEGVGYPQYCSDDCAGRRQQPPPVLTDTGFSLDTKAYKAIANDKTLTRAERIEFLADEGLTHHRIGQLMQTSTSVIKRILRTHKKAHDGHPTYTYLNQ